MNKKIDTNHQGQIGVAWVQWIVEGLWGAGLEVLSAHNDDGVDVILLLKIRKHKQTANSTGDIIFAQIKTGYVSQVPSKDYNLNLGKKHIDLHMSRWRAYPGPVIMINVIPPRITKGDPVAYWTNLRSEKNKLSDGSIHFEIKDKFDAAAKVNIYNLCWQWARLRSLPRLSANIPTSPAIDETAFSKISPYAENLYLIAKEYYKNLMKESKSPLNPFQVVFTRRGWEHITRKSRPSETKIQSLILLPVAMRILLKTTQSESKKITFTDEKSVGQLRRRWYESRTCNATFYARDAAVVRVIIERTQLFHKGILKQDVSVFYSVHEVARRRSFV
ncbi:DUF4365 domain-containing protein [Escherichia sp. E4930]|uniref:DUF4365 domain-containing protein n=1 Tax=Escherichia sp. E4930 TaxID=2044468 RepID=UPI00107F417F|nr:DUF4365 domain-containing protein [Escherichia sp. E4930]TGB69523.1 hypothetical protein CRG96_11900 [Escherichia sp. E4930]TLU80737.1 DUF4365 domain-containing protein [Escherichia sp. E4930]